MSATRSHLPITPFFYCGAAAESFGLVRGPPATPKKRGPHDNHAVVFCHTRAHPYNSSGSGGRQCLYGQRARWSRYGQQTGHSVRHPLSVFHLRATRTNHLSPSNAPFRSAPGARHPLPIASRRRSSGLCWNRSWAKRLSVCLDFVTRHPSSCVPRIAPWRRGLGPTTLRVLYCYRVGCRAHHNHVLDSLQTCAFQHGGRGIVQKLWSIESILA
jgi:hypothetical protein